MPSKLTADSFVTTVRNSGLVDEEILRKAWIRYQAESGPTPDVDTVAEHFVTDNLLTRWQIDKLLQGKHKGFFLGKYKLISLLGSGGMSAVYLAEHTLMRRRVAIKVLPQARIEDTSYLARFHREAQAVAALDHPNIMRAYDVDQEGKVHFLVMEYIEGHSLLDLVTEHGPLKAVDAVDYIRQSADGLAHAHQSGMVHRDIKPGNLLVDKRGTVKILDMGLAMFFDNKESATNRFSDSDAKMASLTIQHDEKVLGTADYLSPEQALNSHDVDVRTDIYSLGCTLYYLLTGHPPFPDGTLAQRLLAHQTKQPKAVEEIRTDLPPGLGEILRKMMAKQREQRIQTAKEVAQLLLRWLIEHGGVEWREKHQGLIGSQGGIKPPVAKPVVAQVVSPAPAATPVAAPVTPPAAKPVAPATPAKPAPAPVASVAPPPVPIAPPPSFAGPEESDFPGIVVTPKAKPAPKAPPPAAPAAPAPVVAQPAPAPTPTAPVPPAPVVAPLIAPPAPALDEAGGGDDTLDFNFPNFGEAPAPAISVTPVAKPAAPPPPVPPPDKPAEKAAQEPVKKPKPAQSGKGNGNTTWLLIGGGNVVAIILIYFVWTTFFSGSTPKTTKSKKGKSKSTQAAGSDKPTGTKLRREVLVGPGQTFGSLAGALQDVKQHAGEMSSKPSARQVIKVAGGTYNERIVIPAGFPPGVEIIVNPGDSAILAPSASGPVIEINAAVRSRIEGFQIQAENKATAIQVTGFSKRLKLAKLTVRGFTQAGVDLVGVSGLGTERVEIEDSQFFAGAATAVGVRIQKGSEPSGNLEIARNRFVGPQAQGILIDTDLEQTTIANNIFAVGEAGIRIQGGKRDLTDIRYSNNTFYQLKTGIQYTDQPKPGSSGLIYYNNLFAEISGQEHAVEQGYVPLEFVAMFSTIGSGAGSNWSDKPSVPTEASIFTNASQAGVKYDFVSTDPQSPDFLAPGPGSPQANGASDKRFGDFVGAVGPKK